MDVRVDVIVVNWNGRHFLPRCLEAIAAAEIATRTVVVDNASTDGSAEYVRTQAPGVHLVALEENAGYAGGANAGLASTSAPFALILNPDVIVAPDHLPILLDRVESDPVIGAAQGKLFRLSPEDFTAGHLPRQVLDSAGHMIRRTRMVFDRGQGETDDGRWDEEASVFSASGAALLVRRAMLQDIALAGLQPFDPLFFAYKEDIDLCWRARLRGWDVRYVPAALAWHVRAMPGPGQRGRKPPPRARRHSWMNHWLLMLRNDRTADLLHHLPWVMGWEVARAGHALMRDQALLPSYVGIWRHILSALRARRAIQSGRRVTNSSLSRWFAVDAFPPEGGTGDPRTREGAGVS